MKLYKLLILATVLMLPAGAYAQTHTTKIYRDTNGDREVVESGGELKVKSGATLTLDSGSTAAISGGINTSGVTFSTALTGNPLVQQNYTDVTVSTSLTSASMTTLIASTAGRTIIPNGALTIMVSGTAATATALALECSDGRLIASWPIADLVDQVPMGIGLYISTKSTITLGAGLTKGCAASTALMLSNVGTNIGTTTHVYTNIPYTLQ